MSSVRMSSSKMFFQVLSSCETFASASNAVCVRAIEWSSCWTYTFLVNLAHMSKKTAAVCEARILLAGWLVALIWSLVFVHVLVPLAWSAKDFVLANTSFMLTDDIAVLITWWLTFRSGGISFNCVARCWHMSVWCHSGW